MDAESLFAHASKTCEETWPNTIFSSFHFLERMVLYAEKSWPQIVSMSPRQLRDDLETMNRVLQRINNANDKELRPLWKNYHGVCTSWAVLLASKIADDPNNLCFADDGHHRIAFTRCGILIDSSARVALQLKNDVPYKHGKITYTIKGIGQDKPILSYTRGSKIYTTSLCANWEEAIRRCFCQAILTSEVLCMFRNMRGGKPTFNGQIKWCKGGNTIQWSERKVDARRGMLIEFIQKAVFGSGNQETNKQYQSQMVLFTMEGQRAVQYEIIRGIMQALWGGLIAVFSYPTLETEEFVP